MQDHFYHYTTALNAQAIFNGATDGYRGLLPLRPLLRIHEDEPDYGLPDEAFRPAIFGLTSPIPDSWINPANDMYQGMALLELLLWHTLGLRGHGEVATLLKIRLTASDETAITDYGHFLTGRTKEKRAQTATQRAQNLRAYFNSITSGNAADPDCLRAPEIVCFSAIPLERIDIVETATITGFTDRISRRRERIFHKKDSLSLFINAFLR